jgi:hypothetical protein
MGQRLLYHGENCGVGIVGRDRLIEPHESAIAPLGRVDDRVNVERFVERGIFLDSPS